MLVGLLVDTPRVVLGSTAGMHLVDGNTWQPLARLEPDQSWTVTATPTGLRTAGAAPDALPARVERLLARPAAGGYITVDGKPYRGAVVVRQSGPQRLTAINVVEMEKYLLGVVPREIGKVGPELLEASRAQAVAARTYAVQYLARRAALGFDVYATVQDQVYGGVEAEHPPVSEAVVTTAGEILTYENQPIEAFYHSTCAGQTAAIEEVWAERPRPYLVSVRDVDPRTGEAFDVKSSRFQWTQRWPAAQFDSILAQTLRDSLPAGVGSVGRLRDARVLERTASGRIKRLALQTTTAGFIVGGDRIRWIFLTPEGRILNSSKFDVELVRNPAGDVVEVVATGGGWGHGIGMCQVGAMGRARAGQDYRTILGAYYPGTALRDLY